jgi:phosphoribosylglycinamide formyltransferase-1
MEKLNFKKKICVFISGKGSNLQSLYKYSRLRKSNYKINLVVSNKKKAKGLAFSKNKKIKTIVISDNKENFEKKIFQIIKKEKIDILCLAGFMKILSSNFITKLKIPIINIHPSLLPKYKGLNTHQRAIDNNEKFSGCTVHYVTEKLDSGKIISQKKVKILKKDNVTSLKKKILRLEHKLFPETLDKICKIN